MGFLYKFCKRNKRRVGKKNIIVIKYIKEENVMEFLSTKDSSTLQDILISLG